MPQDKSPWQLSYNYSLTVFQLRAMLPNLHVAIQLKPWNVLRESHTKNRVFENPLSIYPSSSVVSTYHTQQTFPLSQFSPILAETAPNVL